MTTQEILSTLNRMLKKVGEIDDGIYSQQVKDDSKTIMRKAFDFVNTELAESKINQLVYQEFKKRKIKQL